jgi:protease-4
MERVRLNRRRQWAAAAMLVALAAIAGCKSRPFQVCTKDYIHVPETVKAHITTDAPPQRNAGPVSAMPVDGSDHACDRPVIALIDVDGLLANMNMVGPYSAGENPVSLFHEKLAAAAADRRVCAVIVRINSPGGGVAACDMMCHDLRVFRQRTGVPVIAYLMDVGAGGGYYIATAADAIHAHPASVTGGIGVILNLYNLQDTLAQFNVVARPVKSGENINMGSSVEEMTPEVRQWLQAMAGQFHERFKQTVVQSRPRVNAGDPTNFDGRVFTAVEAQSRGLVDQVGYLEDAVAAAEAMSGRPGAGLVMFHRPDDPARSPYAVTPNEPLQEKWLPLNVPGLDRSRFPLFLYLWKIEPSFDR